VFSIYLELRTMGKVHKPSGSECYAPQSEPSRFYSFKFFPCDISSTTLETLENSR
jgi:hypothetical protein